MQTTPYIIGALVFHLLMLFLPFVIGSIHCLWKKNSPSFAKAECFLAYFLVIAVGIQSLIVGYLQIFQPLLIADYLGWPSSPFLTELGMANIAFGILGILSYPFKGGWRSATGVGFSLFLLMVAFGHLKTRMASPHLGIGDIGPTLATEFAIPLSIFTFLILRKL